MKKQTNFISRCALLAVIAGAFSLAQTTFAQGSQDLGTKDDTARLGGTAASPAGVSHPADSGASGPKGKTLGNGSVGQADLQFMMTAAKGGMLEVRMGEMAEKKGQSAEVKKLGAMMVADHTKANAQLMSIAQQKDVSLDAAKKVSKMDLPESNFDQAWLSEMATDHTAMINDFQMESKSGSDAAVKSFAANNLPTLKKHLKAVQSAQAKMKKA